MLIKNEKKNAQNTWKYFIKLKIIYNDNDGDELGMKKAAVTRNYKDFDFTVWEIEYIILFE